MRWHRTRRAAFLVAVTLSVGCLDADLTLSKKDSIIGHPDAGGDGGTAGVGGGGDNGASNNGASSEDGGSNTDGADNNASGTDAGGGDTGGEQTCPSGQSLCSGECVDKTGSDAHCGACGNACPAGSSCSARECVCAGGEALCGGGCVDLSTSDQHCGSCDDPCSGGSICIGGACAASTEVNGVLQATNMWRASGADCGTYGRKDPADPLILDPDLVEAAQVHADDMATNDFFSHTGSDGSNFSQRVGRTDYTGFAIGENIAAGGSQAEGVVQRWVDSDGHCRNLMNPDARHLGAGFQVGGPYGTMWVQVFGR